MVFQGRGGVCMRVRMCVCVGGGEGVEIYMSLQTLQLKCFFSHGSHS